MDKPIYELPVTDEGLPPFGTPGAGGATTPRHGAAPGQMSGPTRVDYTQLPPPADSPAASYLSAPAPTAAPSEAVSAPPAAAHRGSSVPQPGTASVGAPTGPMEPGATGFAPPPPGFTPAPQSPPAAPPHGAAPGFTPAPDAMPGFTPAPGATSGLTPAPNAPALPIPDFQEAPSLVATLQPAAPAFVDDEFTAAARQTVDGDLISALQQVLMLGASDLHVSAGSPPMLRIDGALRAIENAEAWDRARVSDALRSLLTDAQSERFERALELDFAFTLSANARFRVNFYQQRGAIGAAFRLIPTEIKQLGQLGVPEKVGDFAKLPRGLVLVTGPTGSGKSTTLAALIDLVNRTRTDHIVTVEDPIEFLHRNQRSLVNQREVGHDTHDFNSALKHVLRQDPDVILIGELRDLETISVALTAAETGHLVFATLHTQDAAQTIDRVIDVFPPHQQAQVRAQLASTLQGVVCQTLVKRASGSGRAVATELLVTTSAIANLIREGKTYQVRSALQAGRGVGMHTMDQHLAELVNTGQVAFGAAVEKAHDLEDFTRLVNRSGEADAGAPMFTSQMK
tara:strand:+ start:334148 stop:335854 length:1707 start_codon:yes stop_codon:yes gene_type:complete